MTIVIYVTQNCGRCKQLKAWLDSQHIVYDTRNLEDAEVITDLRLDSVFPREAPVLCIDGHYLLSNHIFLGDERIDKEGLRSLLGGSMTKNRIAAIPRHLEEWA